MRPGYSRPTWVASTMSRAASRIASSGACPCSPPRRFRSACHSFRSQSELPSSWSASAAAFESRSCSAARSGARSARSSSARFLDHSIFSGRAAIAFTSVSPSGAPTISASSSGARPPASVSPRKAALSTSSPTTAETALVSSPTCVPASDRSAFRASFSPAWPSFRNATATTSGRASYSRPASSRAFSLSAFSTDRVALI